MIKSFICSAESFRRLLLCFPWRCALFRCLQHKRKKSHLRSVVRMGILHQKALLNALLLPNEKLKTLQDEFRYTELMALQEEAKTLPFGDVWDEYLRRSGLKTGTEWIDEVKKYEKETLSKRK